MIRHKHPTQVSSVGQAFWFLQVAAHQAGKFKVLKPWNSIMRNGRNKVDPVLL